MSRIGVDGVFYNIAINKQVHFKDPATGIDYEYRAKINADVKGNIGNVVLSTYKRKMAGVIDERRIVAFDAFVERLSPANVSVVVYGATATATAPVPAVKPATPSGTSAPMQNMAAATTVAVATDFD
jgi:hypothetical protein